MLHSRLAGIVATRIGEPSYFVKSRTGYEDLRLDTSVTTSVVHAEGAGPTRPDSRPGDLRLKPSREAVTQRPTSPPVALSAVWAKVSPKAALERATTHAGLPPSFNAKLSGSGPKGAGPFFRPTAKSQKGSC